VTSPYASVNCTLMLLKSSIRKTQILRDGVYVRENAKDTATMITMAACNPFEETQYVQGNGRIQRIRVMEELMVAVRASFIKSVGVFPV
jgi:hypothetical protein